MKRSVTEVIRRGFENTVANWPLLVIRVAEGIVMFAIIMIAIVAAVVPVAVSLGLNAIRVDDPGDAAEALLDIIAGQWMVIVYVAALVTIVLIVLVAIHSFVEAGSAAVYVDAERATAPLPVATRAQFKVFTGERWWSGARRDWWPVFWIYNIAWSVAGLVVLLPFVAMLALMLVFRENPAALIGVTCLGLTAGLLLFLFVAVITNIWCQKAIVVCVARLHRAPGALGEAWREFRADAGRHIGVAVILFVLMMVGSGVFASVSFVGGLNDSPGFAMAMLPLQFAGSIANSIFSSLIAAWFLACFASLTVSSHASSAPTVNDEG